MLFVAEPGEFLAIDTDVTDDLTQEAAPEVFTPVDGNDRGPSVFVLPKRMAPLFSNQPKSQARQDRLQLACRDGR